LTSLLQTAGRAAHHLKGEVILYATGPWAGWVGEFPYMTSPLCLTVAIGSR